MSSSTTAGLSDLPTHLTIIVDLNPVQWHLSAQPSNEYPLSLSQFLAQLLVFVNAHLAGKDENTVAIIGAFPAYSQMLYKTGDEVGVQETPSREHSNSYQPFRVVDSKLTEQIQNELQKAAEAESIGDKAIVGAITKALCRMSSSVSR